MQYKFPENFGGEQLLPAPSLKDVSTKYTAMCSIIGTIKIQMPF